MAHDDKNRRWSNYWKQGHITSFGKATPENYSSVIKDFWFRQFELLENESVILDLATGNGAVAVLAMEFSDKYSKDITVFAADAAVINNSLTECSKALKKYRDKIQFFSSTPCEHLLFDNASVDLVCSQFGIEYSHLRHSIPEVSRVLRDGGRFAAIMHHHMSVTVLGTQRNKSILEEAMYKSDIFEILKQYFKVFGNVDDAASIQIARQRPEVLNCEKELWVAVSSLKDKYPNNNTVENFLDTINRFTMDHISMPEGERLTGLDDLMDGYRGMIERKNDLQEAAMTEAAMTKLQDLMNESGFKDFTYMEHMNSSSQLAGWKVNAHK